MPPSSLRPCARESVAAKHPAHPRGWVNRGHVRPYLDDQGTTGRERDLGGPKKKECGFKEVRPEILDPRGSKRKGNLARTLIFTYQHIITYVHTSLKKSLDLSGF